MPAEKFTQYRHFRDFENGKRLPSLSFRFDVDQVTEDLTFSYSLCHAADNFSREVAIDLCNMRIRDGHSFTRKYNRDLSLVENAVEALINAESDAAAFPDDEGMQNQRRSIRTVLHAAFLISLHKKMDESHAIQEKYGMWSNIVELYRYGWNDDKEPGLNFPYELHEFYINKE